MLIFLLKTIVITLIGVPSMVAIVVGGPMLWWDARTNFGLHATDNFSFGLSISLASIVVFIAAKAYRRVRDDADAERAFPLFLNRVFPLQVLVGIGFAMFIANGIHDQRTSQHTNFAMMYCAEVLCPVPDGEYLFIDDCVPAQPGSPCFSIGRACLRENSGVPFEQREKAEVQCIRDRVTVP